VSGGPARLDQTDALDHQEYQARSSSTGWECAALVVVVAETGKALCSI
jgi:hypothetical protein